MFAFINTWKLRRVARILAETIGSEAWRNLPRSGPKSEKVGETLVATHDGWRIWDAHACFLALGIHVVDHYARNYLTPTQREALIDKLIIRPGIGHLAL